LAITITSVVIGTFAIERSRSIAVTALADSLSHDVQSYAPIGNPYTSARLIENASPYPVQIVMTSDFKNYSNLTYQIVFLKKALNQKEILDSQDDSLPINDKVLIRSLKLTDSSYVIFILSLNSINKNYLLETKELIYFIISFVFILSIIVFFLFRNDNEINSLNQALSENQRQMEEFVGDASHELRTPLTVIRGYAEMLTRSDKPSATDQEKYLSKINIEIRKMERLIRDLLLLADSNEDPSIRENGSRINLAVLLQDAIENFEATAPDYPIEIMPMQSSFIFGDDRLIGQLISNIFSNIRNHTPVGTRVRVSLLPARKFVHIIIEDSGPGLPGKIRLNDSKIFKRLNSELRTSSSGSGLGLSIINKIARRHGGTVQFSKSELGGVSVEIILPVAIEN
jgi:signal transduction histidine kinase